MSFSVSYTKTSLRKSYPYDDWRARGNVHETVFQFKSHYQEATNTKMFFMPGHKFGYIEHYSEFVVQYFKLWVELSFDDVGKVVHVDRLFCERKNYWGDDYYNDDDLKSGSGGIGYYKKNLVYLSDDIGIDRFVTRLFGQDWKLAPLPLTCPQIKKEHMELVEQCNAAFGHYNYGPWFKVVGFFPIEREICATIIQKHFRGWQARMQYRFNPTTTLGRYICLCELEKLGYHV